MKLFVPALLLPLLGACTTQRFPGPMDPVVRPLPPGDVPPPPHGPQEIIVFRLSDPVLVRRAGETAGYPLTVYQKQERLRSGGSVLCAAGGRCELLWPDAASSVLIFDEGVVDLGEPSRDEPLVTFKKLTRSRVFLRPEDSVAVMGGALLRGDPEEKSGPFLLDRVRDDVIKITNQSKRACTVSFREDDLVVSPGEVMRIPLLDAGGAPIQRDPAEVEVTVAGRQVPVVGEVEAREHELAAKSDALVRALGVQVFLGRGETLVLDVFGAAEQAPAPAPAPLPEPATRVEPVPVPDPAGGPEPGAEPGEEPPAPPPSAEPAEEPAAEPAEEPAEEPAGEEPPEDAEAPQATAAPLSMQEAPLVPDPTA